MLLMLWLGAGVYAPLAAAALPPKELAAITGELNLLLDTPAPAPAGWDAYNPPYPRLGATRLQPQNATSPSNPAYGSTFLNWAKNLNLIVMGGNYVSARSSTSWWNPSVDSFVRNAHAAGIDIVLQYMDASYYVSGSESQQPGYGSYVDAHNWQVYLTGTSGALAGNAGFPIPNQSTYVSDSNGDNFSSYFAKWYIANFINPSLFPSLAVMSNTSTSIDGPYIDDDWAQCRFNGDVKRTGTSGIGPSNANLVGELGIQWRTGKKRLYDQYLASIPGAFLFANQDYYYQAIQYGGGFNPTTYAPMVGVLHGSQVQYLLGDNLEHFNGFTAAMNSYQLSMNLLRGPKLAMIDASYMQSDGSGPLTWSSSAPFAPTSYTPAYQYERYAIAFALMGSGLLDFDGHDDWTDTHLYWFEEWGGLPGSTYTKGYLGYPTDAVQTSYFWNQGPFGVWKRRFYNTSTGRAYWAIMNPRGNGPQTVSLGRTMYKLHGIQNPSYNNFAAITTLSLADADGAIIAENPQ